MPRPSVAARLAPFGTSVFAEMSALALQHDAVNLSQGFPDFDGPAFVRDAASRAIASGHNQYAPMPGLPTLRHAIARDWSARAGLPLADPLAQVSVTSGCTEALAATFLGLIEPGDEIILFEPFYDSYRACIALAGGTPRFVRLHPPRSGDGTFTFDPDDLRRAFTPRTRAILVNTPHNPTGKVFTRDELNLIASLCLEHDTLAITDEVYERLTFNPALPHLSLAAFPAMADRTITLSSLGKTFSLTGWKVGWAIASPDLIRAVRAAHQFLTFATSTPMQHAAVEALDRADDYVPGLLDDYLEARDFLADALGSLGFRVFIPDGTYFIIADHARFGFLDDVAFCRHLTASIGVAAIPPGAFYSDPDAARTLVRFAFCKRRETLALAVERLARLRPIGPAAHA